MYTLAVQKIIYWTADFDNLISNAFTQKETENNQ